MADKRFADSPGDVNPAGTDIIPGTDISLGEDRKYTFDTFGAFAKVFIGNATQSVSGLMSIADKVKLDNYAVHNPGNNLYLTTNGSGNQVWVAILTAVGDMTKATYDTAGNNQCDLADAADKITVDPGNDYVWVTDNAGLQGWVLQSAIADMKRSSYAVASATKVDRAIASDTAEGLLLNPAATWFGVTSGAGATEIFLDGIAAQLVLATDTAIMATIHIAALQDDKTDAAYFTRQVVIANNGGVTGLVGAVQTVGTDIDSASIGGVTITADVGNNALKLEVDGKAVENWNWSARTILITL